MFEQKFESAIQKIFTNLKQYLVSGIHSLESRNFQLKFLDKISVPVFTGTQIKGKGGTPIRVALVDAITDQVVKYGPEASARVKIVVVEGDFDGDKRSNWTFEEFNNKIITEMGGKKSLITGHVYLDLKEGIGFVGEISFKHKAKWMKRSEYKLGAVMEYLRENRVREAITESIVVKDRRMTFNGKKRPPSQSDEVQRLVNIDKGGPSHKILDNENIKTVKDFLTHYNKNPQWLREILGRAMTDKMWEATVKHARTCILDKKLHLYFPTSFQKGVVFNVVGQVMGLILERCFFPIDQLSEAQKVDAHKSVVYALEHMEEVLSFDDETCMHDYLTGNGHDHHAEPSTSAHNNELAPFDDETLVYASLQLVEASDTSYGHDHAQSSTHVHNNEQAVEYPNNCNFETSYFNNGHVQPSSDSLGISSFLPPFGTSSDLNAHGLQDTMSFRADEHLRFLATDNSHQYQSSNLESLGGDLNSFVSSFLSSFGTSSDLNAHGLQDTMSFCADQHFQFLATDNSHQYQSSNLESWGGDLNSFVRSGFRFCTVAKAQRRNTRWTKLSFALQWYSSRKSVASKSVSSETIHAPKRARIY
ncbi:calmodulin-binding protein 60 A-like isoform X2 [Actinidia eriantha]|uniref:calmodulin-binding protein 60 A-like isoform X2 n=1 Tax=Actinidia eriantha TaxID=165200 RepID=UPI00258F21FA|nr:calmodulin-binding protein 60 A-like isoform X2 [Actinidia eriantha]XP_057459946.1 calmodulin-binding protein 60 A-like isoform X2 [Actinidia eriantha]